MLTRPSKSPSPLLLFLLHGLGSNEEDLFALAPELDDRYTVVSVRAPAIYEGGGYQWFHIGWSEHGLDWNEQEIRESVESLANIVQKVQEEKRIRPERTIVGGFSQGGIMSAGLLSEKPNLVGGTVIMSGAAVLPLQDASKKHKVLIQHGSLDPIVPVNYGRESAKALISAGAEVKYLEYEMPHTINFESLRDLKGWLARYADESGTNPSF